MRMKKACFLPFLLLPFVLFSQVSEEQQKRDSLALLNAEIKAQTDSTNLQPLVLKSEKEVSRTSPFVAAENDSLREAERIKHKPVRALWMSAVLPGLGQAYNKKYWKIPIVYAGFGGLGYAIYYTSHNYNLARTAYRVQVGTTPANGHNGSYNGITDAATLKVYRDYHKRNLTIACAFTAVWYALNLVDAVVDAHLFSFNVNDKLSAHWSPMLAPNYYANTTQMAGGLQINLQF